MLLLTKIQNSKKKSKENFLKKELKSVMRIGSAHKYSDSKCKESVRLHDGLYPP